MLFSSRDGILYALSNPQIDEKGGEVVLRNLPFFEVLHEFIYRLAAQDRTGKHGVYVISFFFLHYILPSKTLLLD